ncbi:MULTISPECIES: C40 family peptidase [Niastella]|uniref:C40 family peptidase n=1 Tax=Niastella soli TaxID=2821487 RepID=A0ABS3Z050_9BACT|nr:C40 family peptidase [Niastella soli]MBO9203142.1 C40 family peptidase [Niastella soli]
MAYAICRVPVAPLRAEPAHKSEMISQLLLAEAAIILEETKDFIKLQCLYDGYEGWCQRSQLTITETWNNNGQSSLFTSNWINSITINEVPAYVPMGIPVPDAENAKQLSGVLKIGFGNAAIWNSATVKPEGAAIRERAEQALNTPYLWGGRSVFGIDCSGFTQLVFRFFNIALLRDAYLQATQGEVVGFLQEARCGDLAFFDNAEGRITHVGILLNDHEIIHASGNVRIDKIDNAGIVNVDTGVRTHQLRIIKRYF